MLTRIFCSRVRAMMAVAALCAAFSLCGRPAGAGQYQKFSDLDGKRIGMLQGTMFEYLVNETLDYTQIQMYSELGPMIDDLLNGEIDCVVDDEPVLHYLAAHNPRLRLLDERLMEDNYGLAMRKDEPDLLVRFDTAIVTLLKEGAVGKMVDKWMNGFEKETPAPGAAAGSRVVRLGMYTEGRPFIFVNKDGKPVGLEVELVQAVCRRLGFGLEVVPIGEFDAVFDALEAGEVDVIAGCISITEERKRRFAFTLPHYRAGPAVAVAADR